MDWEIEKLVKVSVIVGSLFAGIGIFYHYVIFIPNLENQKIQRANIEKQAASLSYKTCMSDASENYNLNWRIACESVAKARAENLKNCLTTILTERECKNIHGNIDPAPDCSLPKDKGDSVDQAYQEEQQRCLLEAKNGF